MCRLQKMSVSTQLVKCPCFYCRNNIEFDASALPDPGWLGNSPSGILNKTAPGILETECPHCGKKTWLYHPDNNEGRFRASEKFRKDPRRTFTCPVCKHELAANAKTCPHCGNRFGASIGTIIGVVIFVLLALWFIGGCLAAL